MPAIDGCARDIQHAQALDDGVVERLVVPAIGFAQEDAHHFGFARFALVDGFGSRRVLVFRDGLDDGRVLNFDEAVGNHVIERRKKLVDFRRRSR